MVFICKKYLSTLHTNKHSDNFLILPLFSLIEYDKSCIAHIIYSWSKSEKSAVLARFIFVPYPCLFWEGLRPEHNCCGPTHHYQSIANENKKIRIGYVLKSADVGNLFSRRNSENSSHPRMRTSVQIYIHPHMIAHTRALPPTPAPTHRTPMHTHTHPGTPPHTCAHLRTPRYTRAHLYTPGHTRTHPTHTHWYP